MADRDTRAKAATDWYAANAWDQLATANLVNGILAAADVDDRENGIVRVSRDLLESLADPDDCWLDHHGGCQAHGYISLAQGQECPQYELKRLLSEAVQP